MKKKSHLTAATLSVRDESVNYKESSYLISVIVFSWEHSKSLGEEQSSGTDVVLFLLFLFYSFSLPFFCFFFFMSPSASLRRLCVIDRLRLLCVG